PPYSRRAPEDADRERYQTVYAAHDGSVAAPTAGLHFTPELLADLYTRQVRVASIDLHVGPGTFKPVESEDISQHTMHAEPYEITPGAAEWINHAVERKRGVGGVGTAVARAVEAAVNTACMVCLGLGETAIVLCAPLALHVVNLWFTYF